MAENNLANATTSQLNSGVPNYSVSAKIVDEAGIQPETYWTNPFWTTYLGYLKTIPEYARAVRSLAIWTCGRGWTASPEDTVTLDNIRGWGEDTIDSILQDMIVVKKTNGDSYSEIITNDKGTLINLKKQNPGRVRHAVNPKGLLEGYDVLQADGTWQRFKVHEIFHLCNDRIANEIHGVSVLESCKWVIDAYNEAMSDLRRIMHRTTIRVLYIDMEDTSKIGTVREQYKEAIKNGEVLILPGKASDAGFQDLSVPPVQAFMEWIRYLNNYFYEVLGVPKVITGGTADYTEASSKIGAWTFEQPAMTEARLLEQDIWNQLAIRIKFEAAPSMMDNIQSDQTKNTGQMGFQPNAVQVGVGQ